MAGSVNKVILVGNLGADPEIRTLNSGDRVANLRVATSETWRDRSSGELRLINLASLDEVSVRASHSVNLVPAGWTQATFEEVARIPHSAPR